MNTGDLLAQRRPDHGAEPFQMMGNAGLDRLSRLFRPRGEVIGDPQGIVNQTVGHAGVERVEQGGQQQMIGEGERIGIHRADIVGHEEAPEAEPTIVAKPAESAE